MNKQNILVALLSVFRKFGYEGATLSEISKATGLGKASLYHHFPEGKASMAIAVLTHLEQIRENKVLSVLRTTDTPINRLQAMTNAIQEIYEGGQQPCLLAILSIGESHPQFKALIDPAFNNLIDAITVVLIDAKIEPISARERAENAIILIQGSLILSRALNNNAPFQRILKQLPKLLLS